MRHPGCQDTAGHGSAGKPDFELKQEAAPAAQGQAETTPPAAETTATPPAKPAPPKPPKLVPVPSVVGNLKVFAGKALEQQGFRVKVRGKKLGRVSAQSPAGNSKVAPGTLITITIGG